MAQEYKTWKPEDDTKLAALFRKMDRNRKKVIDMSIEQIHQSHFKAKKFTNFQPLYKPKVRKWNLE